MFKYQTILKINPSVTALSGKASKSLKKKRREKALSSKIDTVAQAKNVDKNLNENSSNSMSVNSRVVSKLPFTVVARESITRSNGDLLGVFEIGPLQMGQGLTLGSTLRRAILGNLTGSAVTGFRINDARHEFSAVNNIKEDLLDVIANLKELKIKKGAFKTSVIGYVFVTGPQIVTAGMFRFPKETVQIINASQYICTVTTGTALIEIEVSTAAGYEKGTRCEDKNNSTVVSIATEGTYPALIHVDTNFTPIKSVNYKVKLGHDTHGILSDIVEFTVLTNGTCSPRRAISEGAKEIIELFYPLVLTKNLIRIASSVA